MTASDSNIHISDYDAAILVAMARAETLNASWEACLELDSDEPDEHVAVASHAADAAVEAARATSVAYMIAHDVTRTWQLTEAGYSYEEIEADSATEALDIARDNVDRANYSDAEGTIWIDVRVSCEATGEEETATVELHEDEPSCTESAHDWQSPHEILGGCESNPGVWGHGGGVIIREVCMCCGCERVTDTWAQRPDTGEQGLTSVSYEPGKYADEINEEDA